MLHVIIRCYITYGNWSTESMEASLEAFETIKYFNDTSSDCQNLSSIENRISTSFDANIPVSTEISRISIQSQIMMSWKISHDTTDRSTWNCHCCSVACFEAKQRVYCSLSALSPPQNSVHSRNGSLYDIIARSNQHEKSNNFLPNTKHANLRQWHVYQNVQILEGASPWNATSFEPRFEQINTMW